MAPPLASHLNLGCGDRRVAGWTNVDFSARAPGVIAHDLRTPLPFADNAFAVVYHSHVLEHLGPAQARQLLAECLRVLAPGGILRVVVPDLETKAMLYLDRLDAAARAPGTAAEGEHEWMVIETIDQMVRTRPGGTMLEFMRSGKAAAFVAARIGDEYARAAAAPADSPPGRAGGWAVRTRIRARVRRLLATLLGISDAEREELAYRRLGELHLWMYDRVSLAAALGAAGFADVRQEAADSGRIPGWKGGSDFLDVEAGAPRKPDSLYMEGVKP